MTTVRDNSLWQFALRVYPRNQNALLIWQDRHGVPINDLLWLAYARHRGVGVDWHGWRKVEQGRCRRVLRRVRRLRMGLDKTHPNRKLALTWELELEAIDLRLLYGCVDIDQPYRPADTGRLARYWRVDKAALTRFVSHLASADNEDET